jgi:hypothetical protein
MRVDVYAEEMTERVEMIKEFEAKLCPNHRSIFSKMKLVTMRLVGSKT